MEHDEHFNQKKKVIVKGVLALLKMCGDCGYFFHYFLYVQHNIFTIYKIVNKNSLFPNSSADSFLCCCPNLVTQFSIVFIVRISSISNSPVSTLFFKSTSIESGVNLFVLSTFPDKKYILRSCFTCSLICLPAPRLPNF